MVSVKLGKQGRRDGSAIKSILLFILSDDQNSNLSTYIRHLTTAWNFSSRDLILFWLQWATHMHAHEHAHRQRTHTQIK